MQSQIHSAHVDNLNVSRIIPAATALLCGLMLVLLVGFAPVSEVHNAAHDTRHTAAFPCH